MLQQRGAITFNEIMQQNEVWKSTIDIVNQKRQELVSWFSKEGFGQVVFMGAGSSFHAALISSRFFGNITGVATSAFPSVEIFAGQKLPYEDRRKTLVVTFSRSGETSETLWAIERLKAKSPNSRHLLISANESSPMAAVVEQALFIPQAKEESNVSTKAFTSSILAMKLLTAILMKNNAVYEELVKLPEKLEIKKFHKEIQKITGIKPVHILVSGNGINYGHACEGSSLIKKMSSISSECNYTTELRHGNANHATQNMLAVVISGDSLMKADGYIIGELSQSKCQRLVICEKADNRLGNSDFLIELGSGLSEYTRDLLIAPIMQELGFYLAISKAYNPDKPKHTSHVVTWKEHFFQE